jgi:hypothetical protein
MLLLFHAVASNFRKQQMMWQLLRRFCSKNNFIESSSTGSRTSY